MALQGSLHDMSVADLIQSYCQDQKTAHLMLTNRGEQAELFFKGGQVVHAAANGHQGEEVVYQTLAWVEGEFSLETGVEPPLISIRQNWPGLLLEGSRRLDEAQAVPVQTHKEQKTMATKKKSELLAEMLTDLLEESSDIEGVAVVDIDGLVYSANLPYKALDETMVGGAAAAVQGLSKRSVQQLQRGNFSQTLIQGDGGNIIIYPLNSETLFIGLTGANVNLGMAFAETRSIATKLRSIM